MAAQLMGLVRELKALNARKKAGETLTSDEESRRKELKEFLKAQLEGGGGGGSEEASVSQVRPDAVASMAPTAAARPATPPPARTPTTPPAPAPAPAPQAVPRPVTAVQPPVAPPRPQPPPVQPRKDAYMIGGVEALFEQASNSEAVNRTAQTRGRPVAQASQTEIAEAEAAADAALRATKKRARATTPEEVEAQLREVGGSYTPPSSDFVLEQYYGDYFGEGLQVADMATTGDLAPIDPREIQFRMALDIAMGGGAGATSVAVPPGLLFLDDFPGLYARRVLAAPAEQNAAADDPTMLIGRRKVTIHLLNGEKKQGLVRSLKRGEMGMKVEVGSGSIEEIPLTTVKAVFVHLQNNAQPPSINGRTITVLFRDQRTVQGDSADFDPNAPVFSLVPPAGRGQFEKIVINMLAVASVS